MHKAFLTQNECKIINGADEVISSIGSGFPSMENATITNLSIKPNNECHTRFDITIVFDLTGWIEMMKCYPQYGKVRDDAPSSLIIDFKIADGIFIDSSYMLSFCGPMKFCRSTDRSMLYEDEGPTEVIEIPGPYNCCFFQSGRAFVIELLEQESTISASIAKDTRDN